MFGSALASRHDRPGPLRVGEQPGRSGIPQDLVGIRLPSELVALVWHHVDAVHGDAPHPSEWERLQLAAQAVRVGLRDLAGGNDVELAGALGLSERTLRRRRELLRDALREDG